MFSRHQRDYTERSAVCSELQDKCTGKNVFIDI